MAERELRHRCMTIGERYPMRSISYERHPTNQYQTIIAVEAKILAIRNGNWPTTSAYLFREQGKLQSNPAQCVSQSTLSDAV